VLKIAHVVNPVQVDSRSDLCVAQPITFETLRIAKDLAHGIVDVSLVAVAYPEDQDFIPDLFLKTPALDRSVLDIRSFQKRRKLPLIKDICDRLYEAVPDADYLIYTNVDIALMPHFYLTVARLIEQGWNGIVINRRNISKTHTQIADLPLMYSEIGKAQGGHDCFIFRRSVYPKYDLGTACIGAAKVGKVMLLNLIYHATRFVEHNDFHLTFHLGNDRVWKSPDLDDYFEHNETELIRIFHQYETVGNLPDHLQIQKLIDRYSPAKDLID
jgi:hypothetical protein